MNTLNLLNREPVEYIVCDMRKQELAILNGRSEYKPYNNTLDRTINQAAKLQFNISIKSGVLQYLVNDNLIKYKNEYYIINDIAIDDSDRTVVTISATHECSELNNKQNGKFEEIAKTVRELVSLVLKDTDWVFGGTDIPDSKKRYLFTENESVFSNLVIIAEVFNARLDFNISPDGIKSVSVYCSSVKNGRYITKGRDLKNVNISYNVDEMVTRLTPFGAVDESINQPIDIMDINPTKKSYIDNFKFYLNQGYTMEDINKYPTKFIKEKTIDNTDCRNSKQLYDWAVEELERISVPKVSCSVSVADISVLEEFMLEPYSLGESITIFDSDIDLEIEADINSIQENLDNPFDSTISISNVKEKNSVLKKMVDSASIVDKVVDSNNKIHGVYIAEATIDTAHIRELDAKVIVGESIYGDKIHGNTITGKHIVGGSITAEDAIFAEGAIGSADISSLSANKLTAGEINTAEIKIVGTDNVIEIEGGQILVNDTSNLALPFNRLIMGKYKLNPEDEEWKYGFLVRGKDGKTVLLDENGVTNAGITDGAIDNNKVASNANIDGSKLNIQTTIKALNQYTGSEKLNGVLIELDGKSLSTKFYEIDNLVTAHGQLLDKHSAEIQQNANNIKLSVTQQTYYEDKKQFETNLNNIQDSISSIQIGGNNLFIGTKDWSSRAWDNIDFDTEVYQGCKVAKVKGMSPNCIITNLNKHNFKFKSGQYYTISMCAKGEVEGLKLNISTAQNSESYKSQLVTTSWKEYSWTFNTANESAVKFLIQSENATDINHINVCRLKLELGNKATDWCPSFDDASLEIADVKQQLNDIKADNKLTPNEKQDLLREIAAYKSEKLVIDAQCELYPEISPDKSKFDVAYNELINYIEPLLDISQLNNTTEINAETFSGYFDKYFESKTSLLSRLSQVSKKRIDDANTTANTAQNNANKAQKELDKLNSINELTPSKKQELNKEWTNIKNSYATNLALANIYKEIVEEKNNYTKSYSALNSLLPPLLNSLTTTQTIDGVNLTNKLTDFYNKQNILLKKVNEISRGIAESAKEDVVNIQIGGRNLVKNSKQESKTQSIALYDIYDISGIKDKSNLNKKIVISLDAKTEGTHDAIDVYLRGIDAIATTNPVVIANNLSDKYKRYYGYIIINANIQNLDFIQLCVRGNTNVSGGSNNSGNFIVKNLKLEFGNKPTDWTPAPEDTQSILDDIFSDSMVTPNEKQSLSREWEEIKAEYLKNKEVAEKLKISTELTNYTQKYNSLKPYMDTILKDKTTTTSINVQEFNTTYNNYINAKITLVSKISTETKKLADNAQNTANTANQTANQNAGALNNMTRDDKLTPVEKLQTDNIMQQIIKEKPSIVSQAQIFNIGTTDYVNKYNALYNYMYGTNGLLVSKNTTSTIVRADFQGYFNNYYMSRQSVLNSITQESKKAADNALADSKKYTDSNVQVINKKFTDLGAKVDVTEQAITNKVWKTDIDKTVTTVKNDLNTKIDGIEIGGRNLVLKSAEAKVDYSAQASKDLILTDGIIEKINSRVGQKISMSFDIDLKNAKAATHQYGMRVGLATFLKYEDDKTDYKEVWFRPEVGESKKGRISGAFTIVKKVKVFTAVLAIQITSDKCLVSYPKIEFGNKATDWTPAPEDTDQAIADVIASTETKISDAVSEIKITTDAITQRVSSTESKVSTHTTQLGQVDGKINSAKNSAISTASTDATNKANKAKSDAISTASTDATNKANKAKSDAISSASTDATNKANKAKSDAISTASTDATNKANKAKSDAISSASTDATNKANKALNDAKGYTNGQITTVNKEISVVKNKTATLETNVNSIQGKVTGVESITSTLNGKVTSQEKRLSTAEQKLTDSSFSIQIQKNQNKVYKFRYIRDYINGNSVNNYNRWAYIKAITNHGLDAASDATIDSSTVNNGYVTVDLKYVRDDINCLVILHYPFVIGESITYHNTKTQISIDGVNWTTVFDSAVSGEYKEPQYGHIITLNYNSFHGMCADFNEDGLTIHNGGIRILNNNNEKVLSGDTNGNLSLVGEFKITSPTGEGIVGEISSIKASDNAIISTTYSHERGFMIGTKGAKDYKNRDYYILKHEIGFRGNEILSLRANDDVNILCGEKYNTPHPYNIGATIGVTKPDGKGEFAGESHNTIDVTWHDILYGGGTGSHIFHISQSKKSTDDPRSRDYPYNGFYIKYGSSDIFSTARGGNTYFGYNPLLIDRNITCNYALTVKGNKSCLEETKHYGEVRSMAIESPAPWRIDYYFGETDENGECIISMDDIFLEYVNTNMRYSVSIQPEGEGVLYPSEYNNTWFKIRGTKNLKFNCEVRALRKGFENDRNLRHLNVEEEYVNLSEIDKDFGEEEQKKAIIEHELQDNTEDILLENNPQNIIENMLFN